MKIESLGKHFLVLLLLALTGCVSQEQDTQPGKNPTVAVSDISAQILTAILTPSPPRLLASTPTKTDQATRTPTVEPLQTRSTTPTAIATLSAEGREHLLVEAMRPREDCLLPCWWGIIPGEASLEEAGQILHEMGASALSDRYFSLFGLGWGMGVEFEVDYDVIQSIEINSPYVPARDDEAAYQESWKAYSVAEVLRRYGIPSQVIAYIPFQGDLGGGQAYKLFLFYDELGAMIEYIGLAEPFGESQYQVCPELNKFWDIHLVLYPPGRIESMVQQVFPPEELDNLWPGISYDQITWEGITGTSLEAFHELITSNEPDEACYEIPHIVDIK